MNVKEGRHGVGFCAVDVKDRGPAWSGALHCGREGGPAWSGVLCFGREGDAWSRSGALLL